MTATPPDPVPLIPRDSLRDAGRPDISAIVCTRDRAGGVAATAASILACDAEAFELIVVDQSADDASERALAPLREDSRLRYIRTPTRGLSVSRNIGARAARADVLAYTDDDCVVRSAWIGDMIQAFRRHPRVGLVFGNVEAGEFDRSQGRLPSYVRSRPILARGMSQKHEVEGMGASMGVRRSLWEALHGFDEVLGAGTPLCSGEDLDFALRCLRAGAFIYEPARATVVHLGFRSWKESDVLIRGYMKGLGAALAKQMRCGGFTVLGVLLRLAWRWFQGAPVVDLGPCPPRGPRLRAFVEGGRRGLTCPLDRRRGLFKVSRGDA